MDVAIRHSIMSCQVLHLHHHSTDCHHNAKVALCRLRSAWAHHRHISHDFHRHIATLSTSRGKLGRKPYSRWSRGMFPCHLYVGPVIHVNSQHHCDGSGLCGSPGYHSHADADEAFNEDHGCNFPLFRFFVSHPLEVLRQPTNSDLPQVLQCRQ